MINRIFFSAILLFLANFVFAQNPAFSQRKSYIAQRIENSPDIDGDLDEEVWKDVPIAGNFVMLEPGDGNPIPSEYDTQVKIIYNDEAIFIGARMKTSDPEKTVKLFTQRDNIGIAEYFLIDINPYDDGENQTRFIVTAAGTQIDGKVIGENEDYTFNAVWESAISHDEQGWYAELKIPYSTLRFPKSEVQQWAIQFARNITHRNEQYTWNYVNRAVGKASQHTGLLNGIQGIAPPVRLMLYPYASAEVKHSENFTESAFSAGMDIKYGINDAFTLDATLVPDFGQVAFDDVELNLTPFEQQFGENRAFFTEGVELFTKGDLFYSRRVGDSPSRRNLVTTERAPNEVIVENPERADLLNAFKISGRTDGNLGIGFFNAITNEANAVFRDTISGEERNMLTEPLSNYNILVFDQQFNKNSSISLINTNVTRNGNFRDGNVTGFLFDVFNKENSYNFKGEAKMSYVNKEPKSELGFASFFSADRTKGNFRYGFSHELANETYDINDLGINFFNNYNNFYWRSSYQIFEPRGNFNRYNIQVYGNHQRRYKPDVSVGTGVGGSFFAMTVDRFAFGGFLEVNSEFKDFFEPRREGSYVLYNPSITSQAWVSSDYRKTFAYDIRFTYGSFFDSPQNNYRLSISPRVRFSDRFTLIYSFAYAMEHNRNSFVALQPAKVVFGDRDMKSLENGLQASYNFNTKQAINLSFRNFWSTAHFYDEGYSDLQPDGRLVSRDYLINGNNTPNTNFNIWNLDLSYNWQFAPGSEAILLYRNSIFNQDDQSLLDYRRSLGNLFSQPIDQVISLRIVYFIDYNDLKNRLSS